MFNPDVGGGDQPALAEILGKGLRLVSQVGGLILILTGAYYAVWIIVAAIQCARDPAELEPALAAMSKALDLEGATVPMGESKIPLGRTVAGVLLLLWYVVSAWVALALVNVGGKLVLGVIGERREFLAAMKEFLVTMRTEGTAGNPANKSTK